MFKLNHLLRHIYFPAWKVKINTSPNYVHKLVFVEPAKLYFVIKGNKPVKDEIVLSDDSFVGMFLSDLTLQFWYILPILIIYVVCMHVVTNVC
jgi:hypothetical protein